MEATADCSPKTTVYFFRSIKSWAGKGSSSSLSRFFRDGFKIRFLSSSIHPIPSINFISSRLFLSDLNSLDGTYISGASVGSFFTFKGVGDVNNDGFDDFVINTPYETWTSNYSGLQTGQSFLVYGQSEWLGEFENADLETVIINGDILGLQVVGLGDFSPYAHTPDQPAGGHALPQLSRNHGCPCHGINGTPVHLAGFFRIPPPELSC